MLRKGSVPLLVIILLVSLKVGNRYLSFAILMLLAILLVITIWNRYCFRKLNVLRKFTQNNLFPGEETQYIIEIENRKILPMLWLEVSDQVTKGVEFRNSALLGNRIGSPYNTFTDIFSLKWYEKVTRKYHVQPTRRGYFTFGKSQYRTADLFGLFVKTSMGTDKIHLLVYPHILPMDRFGLPRINPFGRRQMNRWIYEDPANKAGVRPYQQGDRYSQINWRATARQQALHSNVIKPTMDTKMQIILNTRMMNNLWEGFDSNRFEVAVIVAASVVEYALQEHYQTGLLTNGIIYEESSFVKILPGKSSGQREKLLKALAMIEPYHHKDIDEMIYRELPNLEVGTVVVFISTIMNEHLTDCLRVLHRRGYRPTVIKIGALEEEHASALAGIPTYIVEEERIWNEIEHIQLRRESIG